MLRIHQRSWSDPSIDPKTYVPDSVRTLAETCIQCARHSYQIITDAWIHGTFGTFDYFNTQYLFSAATILAISSLLRSSKSDSDGDNFSNAVELLRQLDQSGSFGAKEFCEHIDAMQQSMAAVQAGISNQFAPPPSLDGTQGTIEPFNGNRMTAGMALAEPSFQDFLAGTTMGMQVFDESGFEGLHTPYWPELWGDGWAGAAVG